MRFAHALIDGGVDVVHGHSSHHPRPLEIYRGKPVLHGCGDFIDDYEGITGYEHYRDDLRPLYLVSVEPATGRLREVRIVPLQARRMRLRHASGEDSAWLGAVLDRISRDFHARVDTGERRHAHRAGVGRGTRPPSAASCFPGLREPPAEGSRRVAVAARRFITVPDGFAA